MTKNRILGAAVAGALLTPAGVALAAAPDAAVRPVVPRALQAGVTEPAEQAAHKRLVRRHMTLVRRYQRVADVALDRGEISSILLRRDSETVRERTKALREKLREERAEQRRAKRGRGGQGSGGSGGGSAPSAALQAIAQCESGGDPSAVSPGGQYRGKYQFSRETWAAVGGSGDPAGAPEAEQDRRAAMLMQRAGPGQWPVCGG